VLSVHGVEADEALHGLVLDGIFILTAAVGTEDGVLYEGHIAAEPGPDALRGLLVTNGAIDTVECERIGQGFQQGVVLRAFVVGGKMAHRSMATGALVLQPCGMGGVGDDFMAHFGPPERVLRAVGHDGAAPIVHHVDVPAIRLGHHGEGLTGNGSEVIGVFAVTAGTLARPVEKGVDGVGQSAEYVTAHVVFQALMGLDDRAGCESTQLPGCAR